MIHESRHWKTPLIKSAGWLERLQIHEDSSESVWARIEREIFVGFYSVRKLIQTFKVSNSTSFLQLQVKYFPIRPGEVVDYFNRSDIDELYDLGNPTVETRDIGFFCNQVIHSYVFIISLDEHGALEDFFLASDTMRRHRLYFVSLKHVLHIFRTVGRDYPGDQPYRRNTRTLEWEMFDEEL